MVGIFSEGSFDPDPILAGKLKDNLQDIIDNEIYIDERRKIKKKRALMIIMNKINKENDEVQRKFIYDNYRNLLQHKMNQ